jgi:hypothetical protein
LLSVHDCLYSQLTSISGGRSSILHTEDAPCCGAQTGTPPNVASHERYLISKIRSL